MGSLPILADLYSPLSVRKTKKSRWQRILLFKFIRQILTLFLTPQVDRPFSVSKQNKPLLVSPVGYPLYSHHALLAGAMGGYIVWGKYSSINYQIVLYLMSRVVVGVLKRLLFYLPTSTPHQQLLERNSNKFTTNYRNYVYSFSAAAVWGAVMMLFEDCPEVLHPSLKNSMDEIYRYKFESD